MASVRTLRQQMAQILVSDKVGMHVLEVEPVGLCSRASNLSFPALVSSVQMQMPSVAQ